MEYASLKIKSFLFEFSNMAISYINFGTKIDIFIEFEKLSFFLLIFVVDYGRD
jgi:hypothetical protein